MGTFDLILSSASLADGLSLSASDGLLNTIVSVRFGWFSGVTLRSNTILLPNLPLLSIEVVTDNLPFFTSNSIFFTCFPSSKDVEITFGFNVTSMSGAVTINLPDFVLISNGLLWVVASFLFSAGFFSFNSFGF